MKAETSQLMIKVRGMTCVSCEKRVDAALASLTGVTAVKADQSRGRVTISYDPAAISAERLLDEAKAAITKAGYVFAGLARDTAQPSLAGVLAIAAGLIGAFLLINSQGWFNFLPTVDSSVGLGMIFIAGLLTSVHCVAMCGGIALSQQARVPVASLETGSTNDPASTVAERLAAALRGLQYHLGRIVSYTILGAIVGAVGAVISFSPLTKGLLAAFAGIFMVLMGLRMIGILPRFSRFRPFARLASLPRRLIPGRAISALRGRGPFFVGLLNGFMPCGPLQTMQLYALGTGSAAIGALSMLLFSAGTVPLMFAFGALSSFFSPRWQGRLVKASAIMVVFFGLVMAGRALDLSGAAGMVQTAMGRIMSGPVVAANAETPPVGGSNQVLAGGTAAGGSAVPAGSSTTATIKDGVQYVSFDLKPSAYAPITIQKGLPVKWTINATAASLNGCNGEVTVPQLGLRKKLKVGANVIEFTAPANAGTVSYTCWMGMINSSITVVDKLSAASPVPAPSAAPKAKASSSSLDAGGSGACCGTGTGTATAFAGGVIPSDTIQKAVFKTVEGKKIQEITVTVDQRGYSPAVFVVQKGVPARLSFVAAKLDSCNRYVDFPDYGGGMDLSKGELVTPALPMVQDFVFQCGMNMLHGYVRVVDNLDQANLGEIRTTVAAWKPAAASGGMSCCAPQK